MRAWMVRGTPTELDPAWLRRRFAAGVAPFVLGDLLKIALAALLVPACWGLFGRKD